jgi:hypothetical protein
MIFALYRTCFFGGFPSGSQADDFMEFQGGWDLLHPCESMALPVEVGLDTLKPWGRGGEFYLEIQVGKLVDPPVLKGGWEVLD